MNEVVLLDDWPGLFHLGNPIARVLLIAAVVILGLMA